MRGGEKVVESLCRMYPSADIFTHVVDEQILSKTLKKHNIRTTFISRLPFAKRLYQKYLPLMPSALECLDLSEYDLVISSESGPAKGVIVSPNAVHICYCHSPMRYIWDQYHVYREQAGLFAKLLMPFISPRLRQWDVTSAVRIDKIVANSSFVKRRINKFWGRPVSVVHPPVFVEDFAPVAAEEVEDYYLWVGELVSYKRADLMVKAFAQSGKNLIVIGGPAGAIKDLSKLASPNIKFLGKTDFKTLKDHMARCKALIFPGEEDFGIVPVEVMASGRPVIAFGKGGALDTIQEGKTGMFFHEPTVKSLNGAIEKFEETLLETLDPNYIVQHAEKFNESRFQEEMRLLINEELMKIEEDGAL